MHARINEAGRARLTADRAAAVAATPEHGDPNLLQGFGVKCAVSTTLTPVVRFPAGLAFPSCAQCKTQMAVETFEPQQGSGELVATFRCVACHLVERRLVPADA